MAEKTEAPTPRRREEARRKGQVAISADINSAAILLASFWILSSTGPFLFRTLSSILKRSFMLISTPDLSINMLRTGSISLALMTAQATAPLILIIMLAGVASNVAQVGFMVSEEALRPDLNRVNPMAGLKRIFSSRGLVELIKSAMKIVIISFVVYATIRDNFSIIASSSRTPLPQALSALGSLAMGIGMRVGLLMVAIASADYIFQQRDFERNLRMTRQELIEELKRHENPQLRARVRARQRQLAMRRMMSAVPHADVVITNPTHIAVALCYDKAKMKAPRVVAKGQRLVAERIKENARQHNVPLVENKPLAQSLFKMTEIGQEIPVDLYQAVAEVLAFIYRIRANNNLAGALT